MESTSSRAMPWLLPSVATGGALPLLLLGWDAVNGELGANPIEAALNQLGLLSLIALTATLACTPLQRVFLWPARIRRTLGLLTFAYVTLHLLTWAVVDQGLKGSLLFEDVVKRPFITVGFTAWVLFVPLAVTSTNAMVRRLGYVRWKRLHRLVWLGAALGVIHFIWRAKKDITQPLIFAGVLAVLVLLRIPRRKAV